MCFGSLNRDFNIKSLSLIFPSYFPNCTKDSYTPPTDIYGGLIFLLLNIDSYLKICNLCVLILLFFLAYFSFYKFLFYENIVDLQQHVAFRCTAARFNYTYQLFRFFSLMGYYKTLCKVPFAIQQVLFGYLYVSVYTVIPNS